MSPQVRDYLDHHLVASRWTAIYFQPILYVAVFAVTFRFMLSDQIPVAFEHVGGTLTHRFWDISGILGPFMVMSAWWLMYKAKFEKASLWGLWMRLSGDTMVFIHMLTFHVAAVSCPCQAYETFVNMRYIHAAAMLFVLILVFRDYWALNYNSRLAQVLHENRVANGLG